jgi:hypothetical protein
MADQKDPKASPAAPTPAPETTVTITLSALQELIKNQTNASVAAILAGKSPDERMREEVDKLKGRDRPPIPEELVPCRSPLTGATFNVRVIKSKSFPVGRIMEMVDYVRPIGWDTHREDGGLYDGPRENLQPHPQTGRHTLVYLHWVYKSFYAKDWAELSGKPASVLEMWRERARSDKAAE